MATLILHAPDGRHAATVAEALSVRTALAAAGHRTGGNCGGVGSCGACRVRVLGGRVSAPTPAELRRLTEEERAQGYRLSCQLQLDGDAELALALPDPALPWGPLLREDRSLEVDLPGTPLAHPLGVAVDLGTSHIRVALWDRQQGCRLATRWGSNPQGPWGADVLNRLGAAQSHAQSGAEMAQLARAAILEAIRAMLALDLDGPTWGLEDIGRLVLVGNTAMLALLTGEGVEALLDPAHWQQAIEIGPRDPATWQATWGLPNAELRLPAPLSGFMGSDLAAAVLGTGLLEGPPGSVLVDVGTNTELALWDGARLHVTSVPGGPAFEGCGTRFGTPARPGAIVRVSSPQSGPGFLCEGLDGVPTQGFCGTGLIDAVALLRGAGLLKASGRFASPTGPTGYALDPLLPQSALLAADIDALQRAKAAQASALAELVRTAGLDWPDIPRLCLCGAFGTGLNLDHAQAIGLLPPIEATRIECHAHAALAGCERLLLDPEAPADYVRLASRVEPINLSFINGWEERFIAHLRLTPMPAGSTSREFP